MRKSLSIVVLILVLGFTAHAEAHFYFTQMTPGQNGRIEAKSVEKADYTTVAVLEVTYNDQRFTKNLGQYVWPRVVQFPSIDTALIMADTWGMGTYVYYLNLQTKAMRKWVIPGSASRLSFLRDDAIIATRGSDSSGMSAMNIYLLRYAEVPSTPQRIKSFPGNKAVYFGFQQKNTAYYGFAIMTVDQSTYEGLVYRVTNRLVEDVPSGHRQLTFWSQVGEFRLIDGMGLVARVSEMTFD